jgi:hypothetical protein
MTNLTLFSQIISQLDKTGFKSLVKSKSTDKHNKGFNSWTHLVSMLFCQFAKSTSVRDISNGLRSATGNLNHLGVQKAPSKSTISYQNKHRSWELFRDYYFLLLKSLGQQKGFRKVNFRLKSKILLLDSTLISLSLGLFDWAKYKTSKGAVKIHTLLDYEGSLPVFINMTEGAKADNIAAFDMPIIPNSIIVADRFYNDFKLLNVWDSKQIKFVIRHKENLNFTIIKENFISKLNREYILEDQIIEFSGSQSKKKYKRQLRRVVAWDKVNQQKIELITNHLTASSATIADLYKSRWDIELFFRDVKQLLHIKTFIGTSANAVQIQIWTALITILILKYLKIVAKYSWQLSNLVAFLRLNVFVKIDLMFWLNNPFTEPEKPPSKYKQGVLF